jgi:hypothetical protein
MTAAKVKEIHSKIEKMHKNVSLINLKLTQQQLNRQTLLKRGLHFDLNLKYYSFYLPNI